MFARVTAHMYNYWPCITFFERLVVDPAEAAVAVDCAENVEVVVTSPMRHVSWRAPQQPTLLVVTVALATVAVRHTRLHTTISLYFTLLVIFTTFSLLIVSDIAQHRINKRICLYVCTITIQIIFIIVIISSTYSEALIKNNETEQQMLVV